MNVEENRLRTFADWPANAAVEATRVAKAGFYYTGRALEAQCFLCGIKVSDWNYGDQAIARHRQAEPNCPFVLNPSSTCNVPLVPPPARNTSIASSSTDSSSSSRGTTSSIRSFSSFSNLSRKYRSLSKRLNSFANWPMFSVVSPEKLAKAGFYYLQNADEVKCAFCGGIVFNWQSEDNPETEHRRHFPDCNFYNHQDEDDKLDLSNVIILPGRAVDLAELGVQAHTAPRTPKYATFEERLRTFTGWPDGLKQTPVVLASAGFYYEGVADHVRCFHCDGGLLNWEATDDAWVEHARWFPKCRYVNLVRGQEFIRQCIDSRPPLNPSIFAGVAEEERTELTETPPASVPTTFSPVQNITGATLDKSLHSPAAKAALDVALHVGRLKRALKRRAETAGIPCSNHEQLIVDCLLRKIMEDDNSSESPDSPLLELLSRLDHVIAEQSAIVARQLSDAEANDVYPESDKENETEICRMKADEHEMSEDENKDVKKKTSVKFKETASLEEENRRLKESRLCKICMDKEVAIVFLPCGHLATCFHCAPSLTYCPICRQEIQATIRTFLS